MTNFNLYFSFIVALGSSLAQLFLQWQLAVGMNWVLENKANMKVSPFGNHSLQFQHSCACGAHGEWENWVTEIKPS